MATPVKPILNIGFKLDNGLSVKRRVERVFFTEIYELSGGSFLYLFLNLKPNEIVDKRKKYHLLKIQFGGSEYLGIITSEYEQSQVTKIIEDLTVTKGFDCVAGMEKLKELLVEEVIKPILDPEKYIKFKLSIPNGVLLYGPPGCGKTFIVRKLAEEIDYNFIEVKHSDVASPYIHGSVGLIAKVFDMAKLKAPSIVFIDEIEGLVPKRENLDSTSQYMQGEINEFLLHLNDAGKNKILVVGATNRPHLIDTAILRSGRMDKRIFIPPPDEDARRELFEIYLSGRPHANNIDFNKLSKMTKNFVSSDIELIATDAARLAVAKDLPEINQEMLELIVSKFTPSITEEQIEYYCQFETLERW